MPIEAGQELLHYRLVEKIGEGGMGVVWRARDTTLDRDVAIKLLPPTVSADGERLQRFEREARLLASLNHQNIATIHGFHSAADVHFLVMELVEGEDLEQHIAREPIPLERSVEIATQVARALEVAHSHGVVHRDLKPANVKLMASGDAKVLDFGLAKALAPEIASGDGGSGPSMSPTVTSAGTIAGMILGTAAYMAPEQARGKPVDKRADLWAFGCLLYEMLARNRCFAGETLSDTLAAVLRQEPDWSALPDDTPRAIRRLLRRCLVKDSRNRLSDAADARIELSEALQGEHNDDARPPVTATSPPSKLPWILAACATVIAIIAAIGWKMADGRPAVPVTARQPIELSIIIPESIKLSQTEMQSLAVSPDGRALVFYGIGDDALTSSLFLRTLDDASVTRIPDTEGALNPFFSPDGAWVGFFADGQIRKIQLGTSKAITVCSTSGRPRGASWSDDGRIIFSPSFATGLHQVSASGGEPTLLTEPDLDRKERTHRWPQVVPGHDVVLFTVATTDNPEFYDDAQIVAVRLSTGERKTVYEGASFARYVPTGHLILASSGFLHAVPFDIETLETTGEPQLVAEGVASHKGSGVAYMSVASSGLLAYFPGEARRQGNRLTWLYADGTAKPIAGEDSSQLIDPAVSPDGARVAVAVPSERARDIWVYDLERETRVRLTFQGDNRRPVWTPDGESVSFSSVRGEFSKSAYVTRADGSGVPRELFSKEDSVVEVTGFSPDGTLALLQIGGRKNDIYIKSLGSDTEPIPLVNSPADELHATFSPDGQWIAYTSDETGRYEVFVRPYPGPGGRWQISESGGMIPRWSPDGRRIHYRLNRGWWMVDADPGNARGRPFRTGTPRLIRNDLFFADSTLTYGLSRDDDAILIQVQEWLTSAEIRVVVNGFDDLERTAPN